MTEYNRENLSEEELEWQRRRKERVQRMKLEKEKELKKQRMIKRAIPVVAIALMIGIVTGIAFGGKSEAKPSESGEQMGECVDSQQAESEVSDSNELASNVIDSQTIETEAEAQEIESQQSESQETEFQETEPQAIDTQKIESQEVAAVPKQPEVYEAHTTNATAAPPGEVDSTNVVFIDLESGNVLAQRGYKEVVNPASMTKVLTLLVAAEHITDLEDTFTITIDITDYSYVNDCSNVGFEVGEEVTVRDLLYGTILPSGGDAAVGLATYVAGSHEAFVDMMNDKLKELGLSNTAHFTNCVGIYDKNHHCSVYDMAMIMEAALANDLCREVLGARTYTTSVTPQHPEGITVSNWFIRRIEDKDTGGEILGAKTGYVNESGSCAVSYGVDASGKGYVCATTGAHSSWRCIYDHVALYKVYAKE